MPGDRVRRPLCEMNRERFDALVCIPSVRWIGRVESASDGVGFGEWARLSRVAKVFAIAERALLQPSANEVHEFFKHCLSGNSVAMEMNVAAPSAAVGVGRPSRPTRETAVRVWTVDCLRHICGMNFDEAAVAWGERFPDLRYERGQSSTNLRSTYDRFRSERKRVRVHIDLLHAAVIPSRKAKPRPR